MLTRNKYKKYKQIIFIDTENVGFGLPKDFNSSMYCIYFVNGKSVPNQVIEYNCYHNVEIINLFPLQEKIDTKNKDNFLDFCLVTHVGEIIQLIKDKEIIISTHDNGFLGAIEFLKSRYPHINIKKECCLEENISQKNTLGLDLPDWLISNITKSSKSMEVYQKIKSNTQMENLSRLLSKNQKKFFLLTNKIVPVSHIQGKVKYDVYNKTYSVEFGFGGSEIYLYKEASKEKALAEFEDFYCNLAKLSHLYQSHEYYCQIHKLKLETYVIEADSKNISLFENLCNHMGYDEAHNLISQLT